MKPLGVILLTIASCVGPALADDQWLWNAPPGGLFTVSNNWIDLPTQSVAGVPGAADSALHRGHSAAYTVTSTSNAELGSIVIAANNGVADNATYDFNSRTLLANGGSTMDRYGFDVAPSAGNGRLTLLDGQYRANALRVSAMSSGATARMTVGSGAALFTGAVSGSLLDFDTVGGAGALSQLLERL